MAGTLHGPALLPNIFLHYCDKSQHIVLSERTLFKDAFTLRFRLLHPGVGARAKQGIASSSNAQALSSDPVIRSLAQTALDIIAQSSNSNPFQSGAADSSSPAAGTTTAFGNTFEPNSSGSVPVLTQGSASSGPTSHPAPAAATPFPSSQALPGAPGPSDKVRSLKEALVRFMHQQVYPAEEALEAHASGPNKWTILPLQVDYYYVWQSGRRGWAASVSLVPWNSWFTSQFSLILHCCSLA